MRDVGIGESHELRLSCDKPKEEASRTARSIPIRTGTPKLAVLIFFQIFETANVIAAPLESAQNLPSSAPGRCGIRRMKYFLTRRIALRPVPLPQGDVQNQSFPALMRHRPTVLPFYLFRNLTQGFN